MRPRARWRLNILQNRGETEVPRSDQDYGDPGKRGVSNMPGDIQLMLIGDVVGAPGRSAARTAIARARAAGRALGGRHQCRKRRHAAAHHPRSCRRTLRRRGRYHHPRRSCVGSEGNHAASGHRTAAAPSGQPAARLPRTRLDHAHDFSRPCHGGESAGPRFHAAGQRLSVPLHGCAVANAALFARTGDCRFSRKATSEKIALGWYLDGRVSAVVGTHTHVQTSDEIILPKGTAYITDLGMCGPKTSVLGRTVGAATRRFLTGLPAKLDVAEAPLPVKASMSA